MTEPNPCMNDYELKTFESLLLEKRSRLREHMAFLKRELVDFSLSLTNTSSYSVHMADAASATTEKEYIHRVLQQCDKDLQRIDFALTRIKDKTYGVCIVTGKPINRERLEAIPETDISVEASILIASKNGITAPRSQR